MTAQKIQKAKVLRRARGTIVPKILKGAKILSLLVFLSLFFSQFVLAGELSTRGGEISELSEELKMVKLENQLLENRLAEISSLSHIRERAQSELEMKSSEFEFLTPAQLAQLPR